MDKYTPHESEFSYTGQYPDMPEFEKPWKACVQVSQGHGKISSDGRPLQSEGFSKCIAMLLKNKVNLESALFHVDDIDLKGTQTEVLGYFMENYLRGIDLSPKERKLLLSVTGDVSKYRYPEAMKRVAYQEKMEELNSKGVIKARFIVGSSGRHSVKDRVTGSLLNYLGVHVGDDILVDTGRAHWALVYKPAEARIYVDARSQEKVLTFSF